MMPNYDMLIEINIILGAHRENREDRLNADADPPLYSRSFVKPLAQQLGR